MFLVVLLVGAADGQVAPDTESGTWGNLEVVHGKGFWRDYLDGGISLQEVENAGMATTSCDNARQAERPICELHGAHSKVCKALQEENDRSCNLGETGQAKQNTELGMEDAALSKMKAALHRADRRHAGVHAAMRAFSSLSGGEMDDPETKFALQATGLPLEDPFLAATGELGEGISDDHLDNVISY